MFPLIGCTAPKAQLAANPPPVAAPPAYTGTVAAIRPVASAQDPTGSLQQIMSILGQPAPQPVNASEVIMRLPDDSIKTNVQPAPTSLSVGSQAAVAVAPNATIEPY